MLQKYTAGILGVVLVVVCVSGTFAQDAKKEIKKDTKAAVTSEVKKDVQTTKPVVVAKKDVKKGTQPPTMKYVSCNQAGCGFWAKSHSTKELKGMIKRHAKRHHKIELTAAQLKEMVKKEGTK